MTLEWLIVLVAVLLAANLARAIVKARRRSSSARAHVFSLPEATARQRELNRVRSQMLDFTGARRLPARSSGLRGLWRRFLDKL